MIYLGFGIADLPVYDKALLTVAGGAIPTFLLLRVKNRRINTEIEKNMKDAADDKDGDDLFSETSDN